MARDYGRGVRAALVSLSRGTCYRPDCPEEVLMIEDGKYVLRLDIAHIRALESNGPRYDKDFPDPDDFSNLLLLCKPHHKIVDQIEPNKYTVELLLQWKKDREGPGMSALAGLKRLTEDRLQEMIAESYNSIAERIDDSLARFAEIDSEAAEVLRVLRNELVDGLPERITIDLDAAALVSNAAHDLRGLLDSAAQLAEAADKLAGLQDMAESLETSSDELGSIGTLVEQLRAVVDDMKRYRPEY